MKTVAFGIFMAIVGATAWYNFGDTIVYEAEMAGFIELSEEQQVARFEKCLGL
jgi:hypothetical protein